MSLYDDVCAQIDNTAVVAVVMEEVLEPVKGRGTVIAPPTYSGGEKGEPNYAVGEGAVPRPDGSGWYREVERTGDEIRRAHRVVVNSLGACADAAETALYRQQSRLGITLPAFVVRGEASIEQRAAAVARAVARKSSAKEVAADLSEQIDRALDVRVSTWELAHRTSDAWLKFAKDPETGKQIWADADSAVKAILLNVAHEAGENVYSHAPNAAVFGNWLSSGTARRHAIPRAYSCEITGYGAVAVTRAATKLDRMGGAPESLRVAWTKDGLALAPARGGERPSKSGLGQVPSDPVARGFSCEVILRQASVSLKVLDRFSYPAGDGSRERAVAAKRVYTLLALAGHLLGEEDGFLRSECDLVCVEQRWGWRVHGEPAPVDMEVPTLEQVAEALQRAVAEAESVGLVFSEPILVDLSDAQIDLIVERVLKEGATAFEGDQ